MSQGRSPRPSNQHFVLVEPPRLSRSTLNRAEPPRWDAERLAAGWSTARVVLVDERGRTPMQPGQDGQWRVRPRAAPDLAPDPPDDAVLLGEHAGLAYWALRVRPPVSDDAVPDGDDPLRWYDLRARGSALDAAGVGLLTTAVAVLGWHDVAAHCANCGARTQRRHAGWMRHCPHCGREEYPRTDPAVICLVHDGGRGGSARVLLGRQPGWSPGRYSVFVGFVEAGESLEACVLREIGEEVGLTVSDIRYLGSQAWPFPRALMIGFSAVADASVPLRLTDGEIAEARWVTRDELRAGLRAGDWHAGGRDGGDGDADQPDAGSRDAGDGVTDQLRLPPSVSIARSMLDAWVAAD